MRREISDDFTMYISSPYCSCLALKTFARCPPIPTYRIERIVEGTLPLNPMRSFVTVETRRRSARACFRRNGAARIRRQRRARSLGRKRATRSVIRAVRYHGPVVLSSFLICRARAFPDIPERARWTRRSDAKRPIQLESDARNGSAA